MADKENADELLDLAEHLTNASLALNKRQDKAVESLKEWQKEVGKPTEGLKEALEETKKLK